MNFFLCNVCNRLYSFLRYCKIFMFLFVYLLKFIWDFISINGMLLQHLSNTHILESFLIFSLGNEEFGGGVNY